MIFFLRYKCGSPLVVVSQLSSRKSKEWVYLAVAFDGVITLNLLLWSHYDEVLLSL